MALDIRRKIVLAAMLAIFGAPLPALAYTDLPGVTPPAVADSAGSSECEQVLVRNGFPFEPTNGPRYSYVYSCRQGDVSIESNQLPPSLEREKRGLNY